MRKVGEAPVGQVIGYGGASSVFPRWGCREGGFDCVASLITSPQIAQLPVTPLGRNPGAIQKLNKRECDR